MSKNVFAFIAFNLKCNPDDGGIWSSVYNTVYMFFYDFMAVEFCKKI